MTIENKQERAVLVGLNSPGLEAGQSATDDTLAELAELLETAGGTAEMTVLQNLPTPNGRTFIGEGKVKEVKDLIDRFELDLAVFDNELTPSQSNALSDELGVRVIDRSTLILDIFAQRAKTREGQLQVELAQYKYMLPRLTGMWGHLVRQTASGGSSPIGTRGPGETQLETDRRHIRRRIQKLEQELEELRRVRDTQRRRRTKNSVPVAALVGYTNAGKSTILNYFTGAGIPANDRLFDTLDTTTRRMQISETGEALLSDTVGFIRKLPHHLIEAFKATLEELTYADLIIHVIDASCPDWQERKRIVEELITQLGADQTKRIDVFNKCDMLTDDVLQISDSSVCVSAKTGACMDELKKRIADALDSGDRRVTLRIPYDKARLTDAVYRQGSVKDRRYLDDFIELDAVCPAELLVRLAGYIAE